jgi:hypothetical protein
MTQALILLIGYIVIDATLYYFVFEMRYVMCKLESGSIAEYRKRAKRVRVIKFVMLFGLLALYAPTVNASYILSITIKDPQDYYQLIVMLLVFNRLVFAVTEFYVYSQYFSILSYFINKKKQII